MVKFSKKLYRALREILVALNVLKLYIEGAIPKVMRNLKSKYKNMALTNLKILKFRSIRLVVQLLSNSHGMAKVFLFEIWLISILTSRYILCTVFRK